MAGARVTAAEQLERLLYLLPAAAREGGCRLEALAERLGVSVEEVMRDLEDLTARAYYHPAGWSEDFQIVVEHGRVEVWTPGEFKRPPKLLPLEALALALGFRVLAAEADPGRRAELLEYAARLESRLATAPVDQLVAGFAVEGSGRGGAGVHATLRFAARERRRCRIEYLKPGGAGPESRTIFPYALLRAGAGWYVLGHCTQREAVRAFRLDRILSAEALAEGFEVPPDFDPEDWVEGGGRVYRAEAEEEVEVVVRYSPRIARWIREKGPVVECEDGSVVVRHRVADLRWIVRHVLQYGPEAEVLEPAEVRRRVAEAACRMAGLTARV